MVPVTRVKICGTTNVEDAVRAADLGAWALGMIFFAGSPRRCRQGDAVEIAAALRRRPVELCGVFVNATLDRVAAVADAVGLTAVQLHGDEGPAFCAEVARRTGCKVIKAARVRSQADLRALEAFHTDFHLLDAHAPGLRGGTGATFDWELVRRRRSSVPVIVSGGLTPDNVAEAIAVTRPFAVDVASGVEAAPGRKDPGRLEAFLAAAAAPGAVASRTANPPAAQRGG
jgi:phosphoribosylanthranilate isomerase